MNFRANIDSTIKLKWHFNYTHLKLHDDTIYWIHVQQDYYNVHFDIDSSPVFVSISCRLVLVLTIRTFRGKINYLSSIIRLVPCEHSTLGMRLVPVLTIQTFRGKINCLSSIIGLVLCEYSTLGRRLVPVLTIQILRGENKLFKQYYKVTCSIMWT